MSDITDAQIQSLMLGLEDQVQGAKQMINDYSSLIRDCKIALNRNMESPSRDRVVAWIGSKDKR